MELFDKFYNKALRFLSYRPRSEKEIKDYFFRKKVPQEIISKVIIKLKEQKFINDEEFTKWWIEQRTTVAPRSMRVIKMELKRKGIDDQIISNFKFLISNDLELAKKLIEKKLPRYKSLSKQELYQKLSRFLSSKGFDWDTIKQSIDEVIKKGV